jgi:heme a synthase
VRLPSIGPRTFLRLAQASLVLVVLNIVSGASVRLTDSGLGCPDWPTCSVNSLTPPLSFHPDVEFANRMVVVALVVALAVTVLGALLRRPARRDLRWLAGGLVAGVVGEAALGGIVVYSKLNPFAVMAHFMVGMALLTVALVLVLRAGRAPGIGRARVSPPARRVAGALAGVIALAVVAGTATTGAGPHAGGSGATRLAVPLDDMARLHSSIVLVAGALLLAELFLFYRANAPDAVQERGRLLLAAMAGQGVIGYSQFFLHEPAALVGVHVFGATVVWSATVWFIDGLRVHKAEMAPAMAASAEEVGPGERPGPVAAIVSR